jgi:hypothetical protein
MNFSAMLKAGKFMSGLGLCADLKTPNQAQGQGDISSKLEAQSSKETTPSAQLPAFGFRLRASSCEH